MAGKQVKKTERAKRTVSDEIFMEVRHLNREGEFKDINFTVKKGEILCVAGLVGAGRTEIFKCIFGIYGERARGRNLYRGQKGKY